MKPLILVFLAALAVSAAVAADQKEDRPNYKPPGGYVQDEKTAIAIAVAVWIPIYGEERIEKQKPYIAELRDGVWYVSGTFHQPLFGGMKGGVAEAEISKDDGRVLRVIHGK